MSAPDLDRNGPGAGGNRAREKLLRATPAAERRMMLAGISTAVLIAGDGPPIVLLHGPGEFALTWLRVMPELAKTNRVIVPDLPGHGGFSVGARATRLGPHARVAGRAHRADLPIASRPDWPPPRRCRRGEIRRRARGTPSRACLGRHVRSTPPPTLADVQPDPDQLCREADGWQS